MPNLSAGRNGSCGERQPLPVSWGPQQQGGLGLNNTASLLLRSCCFHPQRQRPERRQSSAPASMASLTEVSRNSCHRTDTHQWASANAQQALEIHSKGTVSKARACDQGRVEAPGHGTPPSAVPGTSAQAQGQDTYNAPLTGRLSRSLEAPATTSSPRFCSGID